MQKFAPVLLLLIFFQTSIAQDSTIQDTAHTVRVLQQVYVHAFGQNRQLISSGASVRVLSHHYADRLNKSSLVNGLNTVAGVRMEERSPGSYRLNIRGSSLRSPFGVRNVKTYWNNIPVTDPGGNTYFNQFAISNFSDIEIVKGPASSMYGAGTGGVILMQQFDQSWKPGISLEYITGSYGLNNVLAGFGFGKNENRNLLTYTHNESDGYRDHTKMRRDNAAFVSQLKISDKQQITTSLLYTNLFYETPGGLTIAEYTANPKQARPATAVFPSAEQAKAAIYQKNLLAGFSHHYAIANDFKNITSVYGAFAQINNPTFRNYERRTEPHFGGRTSFDYVKKINNTNLQFTGGGEWQQGYFNTQVSENRDGNPDTLQTNDDIRFTTYSIFLQADVSIGDSWYITAGASVNKSDVRFKRLSEYPVVEEEKTYQNELSPRLAIVKKFGNSTSLFGSISKGFSPPTISELLPSTGDISTDLEAEQGINYELGARTGLLRNQLQVELTAFYFKLDNALVVRKDSSNADYYVNAGNTDQKGIELSIDYYHFFTSENRVFDYLTIQTAQSYNNFKYGDFKKNATDFSGNYLPSVPEYTISVMADLQLKMGLYLNTTYYHASSIYLNDANTDKAAAYDILGARLGWKIKGIRNIILNIYAGADNLLDETYSLGNDINAAGGRYYNAAPARNYYVGLAFQWLHKSE